MPEPYIEEFTFRGRCAEAEKGVEATYHVVLARFGTDPAGQPTLSRTSALTPAQAAAVGFSLDKILGTVASQALLERDAAKTLVATKDAEIEAAKSAEAAAKADWTEMAKEAEAAKVAKAAAERVAVAALEDKAAVAADLTTAMARIDELSAEPEGPSNPALHWITGGLLGS